MQQGSGIRNVHFVILGDTPQTKESLDAFHVNLDSLPLVKAIRHALVAHLVNLRLSLACQGARLVQRANLRVAKETVPALIALWESLLRLKEVAVVNCVRKEHLLTQPGNKSEFNSC